MSSLGPKFRKPGPKTWKGVNEGVLKFRIRIFRMQKTLENWLRVSGSKLNVSDSHSKNWP